MQLRKSEPNLQHMSASQALEIARAYILEKVRVERREDGGREILFQAPGLLEEHGGHIRLKLTWAMKLVSRIVERQKEIELGLPPGTLQNMGKNPVSFAFVPVLMSESGQRLLNAVSAG